MGGYTRFIRLLTTPFPSLLLHRPPSLIFLRRLPSTTTTYTSYVTLSPSIKSFQQNLHTQPLKGHSPNQYSKPHTWTQWTRFIGALNFLQSPYVLNYQLHAEDAFVLNEQNKLPDEFLRDAASCLAFARARPALIKYLSKKDIKGIVINGTPFLFKSALDTARRTRGLFEDGSNVLECDRASTVDIMKYILSYASKPVGSSVGNSPFRRDLVELFVRNLLRQIVQLSFENVEQKMHAAQQLTSLGGYGQTPRPVVGQHVQMKRGDWICPKCNVMNFPKSLECRKCEESKPKRYGEKWKCPQCKYHNFMKNMACLRCDCKRPGEVGSQLGSCGHNIDKTSMDGKLGENESKKDASKLD